VVSGGEQRPEGRVVFFLQGHHVPASRVRGFAIARALEAAGVSCDLRPCHPSVYGDTMLPHPWRRFRPVFYPAALAVRLGQLRGLRPDDVVVFQRPMFEWPFAWLERIVARGHPTVFDFDDAIYLNRFGRQKLARLVSVVDHVIAGNRILAEAAAAPHKTTIIPTAIDTERFRSQPPRRTRGSEVVVGWTGTHGNYRQLAVAKEGIARALARTGARMLIIADRPPPPSLELLRPTFVPWRPESEVEDLGRVDVGLMPLPDAGYALGKCAFKLLQYMALGRPGVASPVGANVDVITDGVDGFLASDDRAWEETLVRLIEDPDLRTQCGQAARTRVETAYSIRAVLPRYLEIIRRLRGETGNKSAAMA
jgi:glycosyltransferase involved in cell wall biosynthesis